LVDPTPEVAVGGVLVRDGTLLLVLRARGPGAGQWSLPGGRVDAGESVEEALVREMAEETGLAVEVEGLCGVAERRGPGHHYVILDYWCGADPRAEPAAGDDAAEVTWADSSAIARLPLVPCLHEFLTEHGVMERLR
jgi:8-oxo-dGTP diphosphatase